MISTEQVMRLRCLDCGWKDESEPCNAVDTVAFHTKHIEDDYSAPYINHVVEGTIVTVFRSEL